MLTQPTDRIAANHNKIYLFLYKRALYKGSISQQYLLFFAKLSPRFSPLFF
jgi:hypothetical protein